ncbi:MAG: DUF3488 and transglutaminase-like domain-containing protein [Pyrinomonadaceae bacterium]
MGFERFFRLVSYAAVFCGFFSLWISGTFGVGITIGFALLFVGAWFLEDTRWQIGERPGTALIVLALPIFYGLWYTKILGPSSSETWIAGLLARMILCLTAIKLLQRKSDRDWIFLYLMAFFQVLLAAGLSISGLYLVSFILYLLLMVSAIIAFEIRKTSRMVERKISGTVADKRTEISESKLTVRVRRVPAISVALIAFIVLLAIPLFFMLPRVGGAGLGGNQGLKTSGFSERVKLGDFGRIIENDSVVMRVKFEDPAAITDNLYFRGVALDTFDNKSWSASRLEPKIPYPKISRDTIRLNPPTGREPLVEQTIYLEPLQTQVLFALPIAVAVQGNFDGLYLDSYGSISHNRSSERITYKVASDRSVPPLADLRADKQPYSADITNYRSLPAVYDLKIAELAAEVTAGSKNRYDKARAVESYLQNNFGYTLEQKAGGKEPLSDFLFNVREGHCEYFATAMAIMLRTQGIATRIVNGFHGGEYNDAVGMTIVRQCHAHAWVEVYFPGEDAWVTFDPTPYSGQPGGVAPAGLAGTFGKYAEALEAIWIQYFVAFDDQEQRSLGRSMRSGFVEYQAKFAAYIGVTTDLAAEWLSEVRGDKGLQASISAVIYGAVILVGSVLALFLFAWTVRKAIRLNIWGRLYRRFFAKADASIVEFYQRLLIVLETQGYVRSPFQTPLEFAHLVNIPEATSITNRYQQVRFGGRDLSPEESHEITEMLENLRQRGATTKVDP